ncbi:hypothetical protein ACL02P_12455 [Paenibacillus sp. MB22_1]|uniref:hypothetical protein n=1 Tax=unclassified Paenibacillus TaxID=185978 RepID=UPI0001AFDBA2|nr:hypothetical protein [Paenibacillus sp. oral taxon 786]EES72924.1 hypothetical protein POTG_02331 [Paenibacillus sp. oral taxon 786 str. D14]
MQEAHMKLAKHGIKWSSLEPPKHSGELNVSLILNADEGNPRDEMIKKWDAKLDFYH